MNRQHLLAMAVASVAAVATSSAATEPSATPPATTVPAATTPAPQQPMAFSPGFADLMTMLVQPRHLRLFYAASERNWELASFELRELRNALRRVTQTIPRYQNIDVDQAITAMINPPLQATAAAIAAGDSKQFTQAYAALTAGCNACHTYMEHPFLVVKVPETAAGAVFPNQDFKPAP